jgi:hypothetical protein
MAGAAPDERLDEALTYLESRAIDGRWTADGEGGQSSVRDKWVTVHAAHVLRAFRSSATD